MYAYESTHPWISFRLDLRRFTPEVWMLLGEAQSKCEHIAGVVLPPELAERLHQVFLAKGVQATTAIEGNTLSESDVRLRVDGKLELPPSLEYLGVEVDNVVTALNDIGRRCIDESAPPVGFDDVLRYNRHVLANLAGAEVRPGEIRKWSVGVPQYRGAPAEDCEMLVRRLCEWLQSRPFAELEALGVVGVGIVRAILAHLYLAWIHPFGDGNGRTARLVEFHILVSAGVPTPAAHLLSNFYNQTRAEYYRQLEFASESGGDIVPFVRYALRGFVDQLRIQLHEVREHQWALAWESYVSSVFAGQTDAGAARRRDLVFALTRHGEPVAVREMLLLDARVARAYNTVRTLERDVRALEALNLIVRDGRGRFSANRTIMSAFVPARARRTEP